jgi:hypothetical protein
VQDSHADDHRRHRRIRFGVVVAGDAECCFIGPEALSCFESLAALGFDFGCIAVGAPLVPAGVRIGG